MRIGMRTNIDLDDALLAEAMRFSGLSTKRATVEAALREYVEDARRREALEKMRGMGWDGDLDAMRAGRDFRTEDKADDVRPAKRVAGRR
jgi:Arc/MetJ family transcription regulator